MTPADRDGVFAHWPNRITMIRFAGSLVLFAIFAWTRCAVNWRPKVHPTATT